ncbi:MAG: peptidoglycan DD-metalloendopeptidase family protein [bacterium]
MKKSAPPRGHGFHLRLALALCACSLLASPADLQAICPCKLKLFEPIRSTSGGFADALENIAAADGALTEKEESALAKIADWLSANRYPRIKDFLDALDAGDAGTVFECALSGRLSSTDFLPILENDAGDGQKTILTFPFRGEMFVVQGNRGVISHQEGTGNEFAWDLVVMIDGAMSKGNSNRNESYFAWGREVVAPAPGDIVRAENDMPDHGPMTTKMGKANFVRIDHGNGEVSEIYHLMQGSLKITEGDRVERGQTIGLVGNSGISMFPHIHYALDRVVEGKTQPAKARFAAFFARKTGEERRRLVISGVPEQTEYIMDISSRLDARTANAGIK